MIIRLLYNN